MTESADYYPFGLLIEGTRYVDESRRVNAYGYQGDYAEFDARTGWNRFALRGNYDSRLGRWQSSDPAGQFPSPFVGMANAGINGVDPDGAIFGLSHVLSGMLIGGVAGAGIGWAFDRNFEDNWHWWALGGMAAGAGIGAWIKAGIPTGSINMVGKVNPKVSKPQQLPVPKPAPPPPLAIQSVAEMSATISGPAPTIIYSYLTYQGDGHTPATSTINTGTLTWTDILSDGSRTNMTYSAVSGTSHKYPIPEGEWTLSNFRSRTEHAMTRHGVGFSVDITPDPRWYRWDLRIHPDGDTPPSVPGSEGCIALNGDFQELSSFRDRIRGLSGHIRMTLRVRGTYNPRVVTREAIDLTR